MTHHGRRCTTAATALALGLALSLGVAVIPVQAAGDQNARGRCFIEARRSGLISRDANPGNTNFVAGTEGDDDFGAEDLAGSAPVVICGFGGNDYVSGSLGLGPGDVFLGGAGDDVLDVLTGGTFHGGDGNDRIGNAFNSGTFNGGAGDDNVFSLTGGTFNGGDGNDTVDYLESGTFNGGAGDNSVALRSGGTFNED